MAAERETSIMRGVLDLCVLALVAERSRYGYEVTAALNEFDLPAAEGSIYPLLARLERAGAISAEERKSPSGPPRRWWSLTDTGRDVLTAGTATWAHMRTAVDSILQPAATPKGRSR